MRGSQFIRRVLRDDRGATAIEYGLIIALVVIAIIVSVQGVANETNGLWAVVTEKVTESDEPQGDGGDGAGDEAGDEA